MRLGRFQVSSHAPHRRETLPSESLSSVNGSFSSRAHARLRSGASAEMPTISASRAAYFAALSRNRENSSAQPPVKALT